MSAQAYIGVFTKDAGAVTQTITGVGFTPKAGVFVCANNLLGGFENRDTVWTWGFDDGTHARCAGARMLDNVAGGLGVDRAASYYTVTDSVLVPQPSFPFVGIAIAGHVASWTADGFTFQWTTSQSGFTGVQVWFIVFGGAGVSAIVGSHGNITDGATNTFSGLGFTPTFVFTGGLNAVGDLPESLGEVCQFSGGWMNSYGCQSSWAGMAYMQSNTVAPPTYCFRQQRSTKCWSLIARNGTSAGSASFVSMSSGQFQVAIADLVSFTSFYYLALGGITGVIGSFPRGTAVDPQQVTGLGVNPVAVMLASFGAAATTSIISECRMSVGGRAGTHDPHSAWTGSNNNVLTTVCATYTDETAVIAATPVAAGASSTLDSEISTLAMITDGYQMFYSDTSAVADSQVYAAFGDFVSTPPSCPDSAVVIPPTPPPDPGETRLIRRVRVFPLPFDRNLRLSIPRIEVIPQPGVGTTGQGADPQLIMRVSKDGGKTYGTEISMSVGKVGEYFERWYVNRLGQGRNWVVELSMTDPVQWYLLDCFVDLSEGTN